MLISTKCAACGKEKPKERLGYDFVSFKPYCREPHSCNEDNPNSFGNYRARGDHYAKFMSYSDVMEVLRVRAIEENDLRAVEAFELSKKPRTVRIPGIDVALMMIDMRDKDGSTISAVAADIFNKFHKLISSGFDVDDYIEKNYVEPERHTPVALEPQVHHEPTPLPDPPKPEPEPHRLFEPEPQPQEPDTEEDEDQEDGGWVF